MTPAAITFQQLRPIRFLALVFSVIVEQEHRRPCNYRETLCDLRLRNEILHWSF
jgi:hypothetical protein